MDVILLDELSEKINSLNNGLTNTVASINSNVNEVKNTVNNIYSKVDTEIASVLTNTNTNNTGSLTGTLSQKLTTIANNLVGAVNGIGGTYNQGTVHAKLATLILNQCTSFVAGNSIVKFNPITTKVSWFPNVGGYETHQIKELDFSYSTTFCTEPTHKFYKENFKFTANRSGTIKVSFNGSRQSDSYHSGVALFKNIVLPENYIAHAKIQNNVDTQYSFTASVSPGVYYVVPYQSRQGVNFNIFISNLKVSYDIVTNTNIL